MCGTDDFRGRSAARSQTTAAVETVAGASEVDRAIATLVQAFRTDPVARWIYGDPHDYLLHIPRLFRALGTSSFEAGAAQRTSDERWAWSRTLASAGCSRRRWFARGGPCRKHCRRESGRCRQRLRDDRTLPANRAALVPVADRCRSVAPEQGMWGCPDAARPSPMRPGASPGISLVLEPAEYFPVPPAWLRDHGCDPGRLVAFHLSDAAPAALKSTTEREVQAPLRPMPANAGYGCNQ
jgi:hypothetical protein